MTVRGTPTKLSNRWVCLDADASPERVWTLLVLPADSHQPALTVKSTRQQATHPKTDIVVAVVARIVVAIGRAAIPTIGVPGTAPQQLCCPPQLKYRRKERGAEFNCLLPPVSPLPLHITKEMLAQSPGVAMSQVSIPALKALGGLVQ